HPAAMNAAKAVVTSDLRMLNSSFSRPGESRTSHNSSAGERIISAKTPNGAVVSVDTSPGVMQGSGLKDAQTINLTKSRTSEGNDATQKIQELVPDAQAHVSLQRIAYQ